VLKVIIQVYHSDVAIGHEEVIKHGPSGNVGKTNHVLVENVQIHGLKNSDNLFFKCLLNRSVSTISFYFFIPGVSRRADPGAHSGAVGLSQRVGPASVAGAIIAYDASETISPRCPKAPPPKWVSIALAFARSNFRMAWIV
jgi:hypothetical protein